MPDCAFLSFKDVFCLWLPSNCEENVLFASRFDVELIMISRAPFCVIEIICDRIVATSPPDYQNENFVTHY